MAKSKKKASNFIVQGSILAISTVIVRLIGIVYRIPLTNIIGAKAIGVYSAAYNIYAIMLLISSLGIPTAVSRMVAARVAKRQYKNAHRAFLCAILFGGCIGTLSALVTFFGAEFFAEVVLKMPEAKYAIQTLAPTILIMAFLGVFRGYFQGLGTMIPTAISNIIEQIFNAAVSLLAAWYLVGLGKTADKVLNTDMYAKAYGAAGGTIGTGVGALSALLLCLFIYSIYRPVEKRQIKREQKVKSTFESYQTILKVLILTLLPIIFNSAIYNISSLLDNSLFGHYTEFAKIHDKYEMLWGCYEGQYHLLTHVPVAFASALGASIVPAITRASAQNDQPQIVSKINTTIRFTMLISLPSMVGLGVLSGPIVNLLFHLETNELAASLLKFGGITVVLYSLSSVTNAILQGMNRISTPAKNAAIALVLHLVVAAVCLWGFNLGVYGVVISDITFGVIMNVLNMYSISKCISYRQELKKTIVLPAIASALMGVAAFGVYELCMLLTKRNAISVLVSIMVGAMLYGVFLLLSRAVDEVDLYSFPMGTKLVKISKKLHLLP